MKRILSLFGMVAMVLLLTVSCKKEENNGMKTVKISVKIDQTEGKHYVDGSLQRWSVGDKIKVNGIVLEEVAIHDDPTTGSFAVFEGMISEDAVFEPTYYGVYPSTSSMFLYDGPVTEGQWELNDNCVEIEIKDQQQYVENSFDPMAAPMSAKGEDDNIRFQLLYSVARFDLYSSASQPLNVSKLVFRSRPTSSSNKKTEPAYIAGKFIQNQTRNRHNIEEVHTEIVLNCPELVEIPTDVTKAVPFHFVIAPCEMGGFDVDIYTDNNNETPYTTISYDKFFSNFSSAGNFEHFTEVPVSASGN